MSRNHSPFAALSSREQQERWLEFQNARLPYVTGDVDTTISPDDASWLGKSVEKSPAQATASENRPGNANSLDAQAMQQSRHRQYDAIIRRMREAEKQAVQVQSPVSVG